MISTIRFFVIKFHDERGHFKVAGNGQGLLLRWHSINFSPERQPNSEPKAEDNYKS
jgi:hypothetical protein